MDGFAWTVIGSVAGVAGVVVALVFGVMPARAARRQRRVQTAVAATAGQEQARRLGGLLRAPVPDVNARGRDGVIEELTALGLAPDGRVRVLAGLGGIGKSTVARAVAARLADERPVWWVPASDAAALTGLLLGLAGELGAPAGVVAEALAGRVDPPDVLWPELEGRPGWVLILDNADDLEVLACNGREAGSGAGWLRPSRAGLVLVTSRIGDPVGWGPVAEVIRLESLDSTDGGRVLADLAPEGGSDEEAMRLAGRLGGLPLAMHQAGSSLTSPFAAERTFAGYERALAGSQFAELLGRGRGNRDRVTVTWELSLAALEANGAGQARALLRVLSCLDAAVPVPPLLLDDGVLAGVCEGAGAAQECLEGLLSVGLIDLARELGASGRAAVKVHPLVAEVTRHQAGNTLTASAEVAVSLLAAATGRLGVDDPAQAGAWLALVPHLRALYDRHVPLPAAAAADLAQTTARVSMAMLWGGSYLAALQAAQTGIALPHGLDADQPQMLTLRSHRAAAARFLGRAADAEAEYRQVLDAQQRVLGPEHPSTLATRHEIARTLADQGRAADAEAEYRQVLDAEQRVLGPEHPSTLATRHEIARTLADQGRAADAEAEYRQVLDAEQRVLGPEHPSTLATRHEIARTLADQGRAADAEAEYRQVLDAEQRVLGPEHPHTLITADMLRRLVS